MRQKATVESLNPDGTAVLLVRRKSACSGDCHTCGGCGAVGQTLRVRADNPIGAQAGEIVYVEAASMTVLSAAALVYLLPLVGFLVGYLTAAAIGLHAGLVGLSGFVLGLIPAFLYDRHVAKHPPRQTIVGRVEGMPNGFN